MPSLIFTIFVQMKDLPTIRLPTSGEWACNKVEPLRNNFRNSLIKDDMI